MSHPGARDIDPISSTGLLLHIGSPKAGSTAIQSAMHARRADLAEHGVHYAGEGYRPKLAVWAALGVAAMGRPRPDPRLWTALVEECHAHADQRVCLSSEEFSLADAATAERVVSDLGPERVSIVYVVRRIDRLLPSTWQERVKARLTTEYDDWLRMVLGAPSDDWGYRSFWTSRWLPEVLDRWGGAVPRERVILVCADESDHTLVPGAFESLLALPVGTLATDPGWSNRSLTANEVELLRRVNQVARDEQWTLAEYRRIGQGGVVAGFQQIPPAPGSVRIPSIPGWAQERVAELSRQQVEALGSAGVRVIGDPGALLFNPGVIEEPPAVTMVDLDTAAAAVLGGIRAARAQRGRPAPGERGRGEGGRSGASLPSATPLESRRVRQVGTRELARVIAARAKRRITGR